MIRGNKPVSKVVAIAPALAGKLRLAGGYEKLIHFDDSVFDPLIDEQMIENGFDNPAKDALLNELMQAEAPSDKPVR